MEKKKILTKKKLVIKSLNFFQMIISFIFIVVGIGVILADNLLMKDWNKEKILGQLLLSLLMAVIFVYLLGIRLLLQCIRNAKKIVNENLVIVEDHVTKIQGCNVTDEYEGVLFFEKRKAIKGRKGVLVNLYVLNKTEIGDTFYFVYGDDEKEDYITYYMAKDWELEDDLRKYLR